LLGSCSENTKEKKEELITRLTEEFSKSNQSGKFEDARYYLMRIKDTYIELGQNDKASETSAKIEEIDKQIASKAAKDERIKELIVEGVPIIIALIYLIYEFLKQNKRKTKEATKELFRKVTEMGVGLLLFVFLIEFVIPHLNKLYAAVLGAFAVSMILGIISYDSSDKKIFGALKRIIPRIVIGFITAFILVYLFLWIVLSL